MGKKKVKDRSAGADSSSETAGLSCTHIRKGTEHSLLKKVCLNEHWSSCQDCEQDKPEEKQILEDQTDRESPAVWMCLKCGHRGCGRSGNQHAIKHYETPRSEPHCLVLSLDVWSVWCYICDDEVQYSSTGQLAQLITNIRKQVLTAPDKKNAGKKSRKEEISVMNHAEQTQDEEKGKKEKQKSSSKHEDSPKSQKAGAAGSSAVVSVRGLSNLGNTCFFNAVVQSLSQTQYLRELLKQITDEKSSLTITPALSSELDPLQIQLESPGSLTLAMCQLMNEIQETKKGVVTPKELFTQVCKKAPRFKGFQQQDSQELLRYLLDGMRAEEAKRVNSGILEALKSTGKNVEAEQMKKIIKEYEKNGAPRNFVDRVFGGAMSSTVMCKECKTVSLVTEMFLDLSLPVADEAYRKKNQKKAVQHCHSVSDDGDQDTSSLANGNEDMPTGTGSKYQQKKAKKQAKKQAKNQRRQQKQGGKVTLEAITDQSSTDPADSSMQTQTVSVNGSAEAQPADTNQEDSSLEKQNEDQDDEEPEQEHTTSVNNRFTALSEAQPTEDIAEEVNDVEDETEQNCAEEEELVEELNTMSLTTPSEGDVENGEDASEDVKEYTVVNRDPELAFRALACRTAPVKQECSVESCLYQFTEVEHLTENNRLMCVTCAKQQPGYKDGCKKAVYRDALKQMLISDPPAVLTLHLKRF